MPPAASRRPRRPRAVRAVVLALVRLLPTAPGRAAAGRGRSDGRGGSEIWPPPRWHWSARSSQSEERPGGVTGGGESGAARHAREPVPDADDDVARLGQRRGGQNERSQRARRRQPDRDGHQRAERDAPGRIHGRVEAAARAGPARRGERRRTEERHHAEHGAAAPRTWKAGIDSSGNATVNLLSAVGIKFDWASGGTLTLGGQDDKAGILSILDENGKEKIIANKDGITLKDGTKLLSEQGLLASYIFSNQYIQAIGGYNNEPSGIADYTI